MVCALLATTCGDDKAPDDPTQLTGTASTEGSAGTTASTTGPPGSESSPPSTSTSGATSNGYEPIFDVFPPGEIEIDSGPMPPACEVEDDQVDAPPPCDEQAPANSFDPQLQWSWDGDGTFDDSIVAPMVANLTDDNGDGEINLCDIPDVVVMVNDGGCNGANLYVLDGATGTEHFQIPGPFARASTPAIGDIDHDGEPEIIAHAGSSGGCSGTGLAAFEHDGSLKWENLGLGLTGESAIALADLNNDGDVEIMIQHLIVDADGNLLQTLGDTATLSWTTTAVADLDDDADLEVIVGRSAWHHDGSEHYFQAGLTAGQPAVGDVDGDGEPEIVLVHNNGFSLLEADGTIAIPTNNPTGDGDWRRPATIHDLDGDDEAEFAMSSSLHYTSFEGDGTINWSADVADLSGLASGTAFDFLGDGVAEAIYGDESNLWIFDGETGNVELSAPRGSITIVEYPVVVDVDNDGSAEIVVVTNHNDAHPTVQVFRDAQERWIRARRIWNQHTYHVTNVLEDGRIPQFEQPHWEGLNTFRTQAQISTNGDGICKPAG